MTTVAVLVVLLVALALVSRSRRLSLIAAALCVVLGFYIAETGTVDVVRREVADALSFAVGKVAGVIPGIAP